MKALDRGLKLVLYVIFSPFSLSSVEFSLDFLAAKSLSLGKLEFSVFNPVLILSAPSTNLGALSESLSTPSFSALPPADNLFKSACLAASPELI